MAWDPRRDPQNPRRALLMASPPRKQYMGDCQNYGPFLGPLN